MDRFILPVKIERYDFGGAVSITGPLELQSIPFTLGPWTGVAYVTSGSDIKMNDDSIVLEFDIELIPDKQISIADALVHFYGATKHP